MYLWLNYYQAFGLQDKNIVKIIEGFSALIRRTKLLHLWRKKCIMQLKNLY